MAKSHLPIHPHLLHPGTGQPLRAIFVRRDGRVVWPILGAGPEEDAAAAAAAEKAAADKAAADKAAADKAAADAKAAADKAAGETGFPAGTPLEQMTVEQREAYWKFHARKHEERVKAYGDVTPERLKELQDKATKHDALERELMSDKDKAVAEAADKAKSDALSTVTPKLVRAEFRAALKGRVPDEQLDERLTTITEPLDLTKFLKADGDVDTDMVTKFVDGIAPVTGTGTGRRGPTATGHGSGTGSGSSTTALTGREMYEQRHKKRTSANA